MKDESLRIGLFGASGRLGKAIAALALGDPRFTLAAAMTHAKSPNLGADIGGVLLSTSLQTKVDLLIDVSLSPGLAARLDLALEKKIPIVIGTTGLSETDHKLMEKTSLQIPVFYTPNFSIGIALMRKFAADAARLFPTSDVDLIETHHVLKKDAPSGSALAIAKETNRPVSIHSIRSGKIVGEHTLLFNTPEERLTIAHETHTRDAYARGALAAAAYLIQKKPGFYGMGDLIRE